MASLSPPPTTMTTILTLIALALALPQTRIRRRGGGRVVTHLIQCCHGCCCWRHLCHQPGDNGAKDDSRGNRQGRNANIHGREEVGHHDPISMEQQKQKQKPKLKLKLKQKQKQKQKRKQKQKTKSKSTTVAATSLPLCLQTAMPVLPPLLLLHK